MTDAAPAAASDASDALVLFGFTGDLATKMVFPALYALAKKGRLPARVVGVAGRPLDAGAVRQRLRDSLVGDRAGEAAGSGLDDEAAFEALAQATTYVNGDYREPAVFDALKQALAGARRPAHYLAVPPDLFEVVIRALGASGLAQGARLVVEKPFGRDLASAKALDAVARAAFPEDAIFRIDHYLGKEAIQNLLYFRFANAFVEPLWCAAHVDCVQVTLAEDFGIGSRGGFYESAGALRDVVENHLFQVVALLAMEPPASRAEADLQAARTALFGAIRPLAPSDLVRGQYAGYRQEKDVAPDSDVETYVALRLAIDTPRWRGVPWFLRAGKKLARSVVEVQVHLRPAASALPEDAGAAAAATSGNALRFRLQPRHAIALDARVKKPGKAFVGEARALVLCDEHPGEESAYERLLGDAMAGDHALFTDAAGVEAAWRVVEPVLAAPPPVVPYAPGSWGPAQADALVAEHGGWREPRDDMA